MTFDTYPFTPPRVESRDALPAPGTDALILVPIGPESFK